MKKILISTGGSGGHVVPALNFYNHLKENFDVKIYTDQRGSKFIPKEIDKTIFEVKQVPEKKYLLPLKIMFLFFAFIKSIYHLAHNKFDIILSTGGYMSLPIALAARIFNKKIFLFEPNSVLGRSNKLLLSFSYKVFCYDKNLKGFNQRYLDKIIEIEPILNKCFYSQNKNDVVKEVLKILIIGGSQASLFLSKNIKNELIELSSKYKIRVSQQLSKGFNKNEFTEEYKQKNVENNLFYFEENYLCKNCNYDIAISRSGASSLAELAHLNIPFIAIPFPYATDNHQFFNAKRYDDLNCCWILEEKKFNSGDICKLINQIMVNKKEYLEKKSNLKKITEGNTWENINKKITKHFDEN